MSPATVKLHQSLIRLAKGMVSAWETWLSETAGQSTTSGTQQSRAKTSPSLHDASRPSGESSCPSQP